MEKSNRDAVIVAAVRTPIGRRGKTLSQTRPDDLAAEVLNEVIRRSGIDPGEVEDIIMGCGTPTGEQGVNIGRLSTLIADFPVEVPAVTINRMCASSDQATHFATQAIQAGDLDVVIAAGIESMSRVPMGADSAAKFSRRLAKKYWVIPQGESAELIAEKWQISREELDAYSLESHRRAVQAQDQGRFDREIMPLEIDSPEGTPVLFAKDEGPRRNTSMDQLAALVPAFKEGGKITAGNSSQMSDGAAAILFMTRERAKRIGLKPRARIIGRVSVGSDPTLQLSGPISATKKVLQKTGLTLKDLDVIEVNEAFASVVLAWAREFKPDMAKVNPNGGAIALGHPLGATGARIMTTLLNELERRDGRYGLQTMCIGHGMANATIIEREEGL
ncbi:MAG: acetyl-CoA acetyltransferase [Deltaproteobacteria bacterium RBG_13_43_22]|nr:MAG: acetyl-CoA acetyltransferase [Deltaproteobacteria bacterium RBG_13_43_22]